MFGINKNGTKHKIGIIMPAFFPASRTTYDNTTSGLSATKVQGAIDEVATDLGDFIKVTTMTPNINVPAGGYNFCNYTRPTGYRLVSVNMEGNSLAIFCQISKFGGTNRLSFFNAYTLDIQVDQEISLTFVKE